MGFLAVFFVCEKSTHEKCDKTIKVRMKNVKTI